MTITAYPLSWPAAWKRAEPHYRAKSRFSSRRNSRAEAQQLSIADAVERVRDQLQKMGVTDDDLVISSNLTLRLDGFPRSGQIEPEDPGVAVYWEVNGDQRCMAIDLYNRAADNLAAIAATLDAMRAIERHGGAEILNRAFTGFTALDGPAPRRWSDVLGVPAYASTEDVRAAYRVWRSVCHPDRGGNADKFNEIQRAWQTFCAERGLSE